MYLTSLASREQEIHEILKEYNEVHKEGFPAEDLHEVIENIDDIQLG
jgi:HD superfamily phosphodiesterase